MKLRDRSDEAFLYDLKRACLTIAERIKRRQFPDLVSNGEFRDGLLMQLIIIGEAANKITEKTQRRYHGVPWKEIVGLRHVLVHAYWTSDMIQIWNTVTDDVPQLLALLE